MSKSAKSLLSAVAVSDRNCRRRSFSLHKCSKQMKQYETEMFFKAFSGRVLALERVYARFGMRPSALCSVGCSQLCWKSCVWACVLTVRGHVSLSIYLCACDSHKELMVVWKDRGSSAKRGCCFCESSLLHICSFFFTAVQLGSASRIYWCNEGGE
jgi:hypothetical protein